VAVSFIGGGKQSTNSSLGIEQQSLNVKQIKEQIFGESNLLKNSGITYF
jgi:hypothetical protein